MRQGWFRVVPLVMLLGAALAPAVDAGRAADVRTEAFANLAQGVALYKRGDYAQAVAKLEASASAALNNFRAHYYLGLALIGDRRYPEALQALEVALDLDPSHLMSHVAHGDAYLKMGDLEEAQASYFRALKVRPAYAPALDGLGRVAGARSKDDEAISYFKRAIASDNGFAPPYTHLGDLYLAQDRFEEAVELLEEAVSIRPDFAAGLNRLALAYGSLGLENLAVATIQEAIELEPRNAQHPAALGRLQLEQGFAGAADVSFRVALGLDPGLPEARLGLAEVSRQRGRYDDALTEVDTALSDPRTDAAMRQRLQAFRVELVGEKVDAERLEQVVTAGAATPDDYDALARIYARRRLWNDAALLERQAPSSAEQQERLAYLLFQSGQFAEAHSIYAELAGQSDNPELAFNTGVTLAALGDDRRAVEAYRATLERAPGHGYARLYLGNALLRLGLEDEAAATYREFLESDLPGATAARVRRMLQQLAPGFLPAEPPPPPPDAVTESGGGSTR